MDPLVTAPLPPYFAYGSNLNARQMRRRCRGSRVIGPARLDDHALRFRGRSRGWGGATATVEPEPGAVVWGALYELGVGDYDALDAYEGYEGPQAPGNLYDRAPIVVHLASGESVEALTYRIRPHAEGLPSRRYREAIVQGARELGLPEAYIEALATLRVRDEV